MRKPTAVLIDLALILLFALIGRASHHESLMPRHVFATAMPFLVACLVAWAVILVRRREYLGLVGAGIYVWLTTWLGGLALRLSLIHI